MAEDHFAFLEPVKGQTWCIVTRYARIPVYRLDEKRIVLIDSGFPSDEAVILRLLEEKGLVPVAVLTSHNHPDHVGNHAILREKYGAKVYMGPFGAATCDDPLALYNTLGVRVGYREVRDRPKRFSKTDVVLPPKEGEVTVEGARFVLKDLSGHCTEQYGIVTPDNVAYLADAVLSVDQILHTRLHFTTGVEEDLASKERIATWDHDRYIIAHNAVVDDIRETVRVNLEVMRSHLDAFVRLADEPVTLDELVRRYVLDSGADPDRPRSVHAIYYNALPFLSYLTDVGRMECIAGDGYLKYVRTKNDRSGREEKQ